MFFGETRTRVLTSRLIVTAFLLSMCRPALAEEATDQASWATSNLALMLLEKAQLQRGICAVVGIDQDVALQMAMASELLVHARDPRQGEVDRLRVQAYANRLGLDRLAVEQADAWNLPYADNTIDLVVTTVAYPKVLELLDRDEVLRALCPQGAAIIGLAHKTDAAQVADTLKLWAGKEGVDDVSAWTDEFGSWVMFRKPTPENTDSWSHWFHGPDNNPVSSDEVIQAPYLTQFLAGPKFICMPSITTAAGGRTFLAIGHIAHHTREWEMVNRLIARNGYNGTILWERQLPDGYMVHRSAFIATPDVLHMIDGNSCLMLDAKSGAEVGRIRVPGTGGEWKWMAMKDGLLYVMSGPIGPGAKTIKGDRVFGGWSWADLSEGYYSQPRVPWGYGDTLAAYDLKAKKTLWVHKEESPIDSRALAMGDDSLFLYAPNRHFRSLDTTSGAVQWTNADEAVMGLIEQPGRNLVSTPGFRSECISVYTPETIVVQGQTRMNVVAISTTDGSLRWTKKKITNNPNAIYVDGNLVIGVGRQGQHLVLDPISGEELDNLGFRKAACTRLTATPDSFFCRGEGMLRYDRESGVFSIDGAIRPACNDGALPANGMLYLGPWACDCNLQLVGAAAKCAAGDFDFKSVATEEGRLILSPGDIAQVKPLGVRADDWSTYRANNQRSASTSVKLERPAQNPAGAKRHGWVFKPQRQSTPTVPTSAGGVTFVGYEDGTVVAINEAGGRQRWIASTGGPIKMPPTIWNDRAYVGSGDGHVYAYEAATGRLLWRFRASPVERHIPVYGSLSSTWPVNSGVLVEDGIAYFAAGILDSDGTYVYAVDAVTGKIKWQNDSSGHVNPDLRKGVSAQGTLAIHGDRLLIAGGNQLSPASFDLETGECLAPPIPQGQPKAPHGSFVGVFHDEHAIAGGRILYSAPSNQANKGGFFVKTVGKPLMPLNQGDIIPAWNDDALAMVNYRDGKLTLCDAATVSRRLTDGFPRTDGPAVRWRSLYEHFQADEAVRWQSDMGQPNKFQVVSMAMCPDTVVAVVRSQTMARAWPQWHVAALQNGSGVPLWFWKHELPSEPLPDSLIVNRDGHVAVTLLDGSVVSLGSHQQPLPRPDVAPARRTDRPAARTDARPTTRD